MYMKLLVFVVLMMGAVTTAPAQDAVGDVVRAAREAAFTEVERQLIGEYYQRFPDRLPSATADQIARPGPGAGDGQTRGNGKNKGKPDKPKALPPGIAKKLERGGTLPPGLAKRNLAPDLERQLPPVRDGYERVEAGGDIMLIDLATGLITDILTPGQADSRAEGRTVTGNVAQPAAPMREALPREVEEAAAANPAQPPADPNGAAPGRRWWEVWKDD